MGAVCDMTENEVTGKGKGGAFVHVKRKLPKDYSEKGTCFYLVDILPTLKSLL